MNSRFFVAPLACLFGFASFAHADVAADIAAESQKIFPMMSAAEGLVVEGRLDEANQKILDVFPEKSRTPVQAFVLGNVMYTQDAKIAYELHKRAAHDLPDSPEVQYEWAIDQHRAGEYAAAAKSYADFSKANPKNAPAYGLCAECLLRIGRTKEAVAMWQKSVDAPQGTLVDFETLNCSVHSHRSPDRERADLLAKADGGDIAAAEKLIALDCAFERDWWNTVVRHDYLKHDLAVLRKAKFDDAARLDEVLCAGDCAVAADDDSAAIEKSLREHGYIVGDHSKLPQNGAMLSIILGRAVTANILPIDQAKTKWGAAILETAKKQKDVDLYRIAGVLCLNEDRVAQIELDGFTATGDVRFAQAYLAMQRVAKKLKLDDPVLTATSKKFPDDAIVAGLVLDLTSNAGKPTETALISAIEAEYTRFSPGSHAVGVDLPRPGAERLAHYFAMLKADIAGK